MRLEVEINILDTMKERSPHQLPLMVNLLEAQILNLRMAVDSWIRDEKAAKGRKRSTRQLSKEKLRIKWYRKKIKYYENICKKIRGSGLSGVRKEKMVLQNYMRRIKELKNNSELFFKFTNMTPKIFDNLVEMIAPNLKKSKGGLCTEQSLFITLRYFSTGDKLSLIANENKVDASTIFSAIWNTSQALFHSLRLYIKVLSKDDWKSLSENFENNWNIPNCCGVIGGRCVEIKNENYEKFIIMIIFICDDNYYIRLVEPIMLDSKIKKNKLSVSSFEKTIRINEFNIPEDMCKVNGTLVPLYFVGDKTIKLSKNFMTPYLEENLEKKQSMYNSKLSKLTNVLDNTFGIFISRWKFISKGILLNKIFVSSCILAASCLHNYLISSLDSCSIYCPPGYIDTKINDIIEEGSWRNSESLQNTFHNIEFQTDANRAIQIRDALALHCLNDEEIFVEEMEE